MVKKIVLGNTGLNISRLCFGSLTVGPLQLNLSVEKGAEIIDFAFSCGVNFIDTAQYYANYPIIAEAVRCSKLDVVIASKTYAHTKELAVTAVEEARKALGRDKIDIFLLHEQESEHTLRGHREALDVLHEYKARGVITAVGLSTHHVAGVNAAVSWGLDIVHPLLNIAGLGIMDGTRADMENAVRKARDAGLGVYLMKVFGGGNLLCNAAEALNYALSQSDCIAIGMASAEEVAANISFFNNNTFPDGYDTGSNVKKVHVESYCAGCGKCAERCPAGAMSVGGGSAVCDAEKCVLCGYCSGVCPEFGIRIY